MRRRTLTAVDNSAVCRPMGVVPNTHVRGIGVECSQPQRISPSDHESAALSAMEPFKAR